MCMQCVACHICLVWVPYCFTLMSALHTSRDTLQCIQACADQAKDLQVKLYLCESRRWIKKCTWKATRVCGACIRMSVNFTENVILYRDLTLYEQNSVTIVLTQWSTFKITGRHASSQRWWAEWVSMRRADSRRIICKAQPKFCIDMLGHKIRLKVAVCIPCCPAFRRWGTALLWWTARWPQQWKELWPPSGSFAHVSVQLRLDRLPALDPCDRSQMAPWEPVCFFFLLFFVRLTSCWSKTTASLSLRSRLNLENKKPSWRKTTLLCCSLRSCPSLRRWHHNGKDSSTELLFIWHWGLLRCSSLCAFPSRTNRETLLPNFANVCMGKGFLSTLLHAMFREWNVQSQNRLAHEGSWHPFLRLLHGRWLSISPWHTMWSMVIHQHVHVALRFLAVVQAIFHENKMLGVEQNGSLAPDIWAHEPQA